MNIKEAKTEIIHTLQAYLHKDEEGEYTYPLVRQRPILLMGPPGIGKTAIMEQIAEACGIGLVSYTITHHTRQSAIGLPEIVTRKYGDKEMTVTEYTMSEIVASVYECMENTGKKEGILFIDEINCVSETLAPAMLALLQNKTFGSHKIPSGWMLVAAGNPTQYNKSVREFDVVTLDRVRKIEIQADIDAWLEYAWKRNIHGAVLSYLALKKENFYSIENTVDGKFFVTARGWEDLSEILKSYELLGVEVTESLVIQYLQKEEIAGDFAVYYQLYRKYGTDYGIPEILREEADSERYREKTAMAASGYFEERFTVVNLVLAALNSSMADFERRDKETAELHSVLTYLKNFLKGKEDILSMEEFIGNQKKSLDIKIQAELIFGEEKNRQKRIIRKLEDYSLTLKKEHISDAEEGFGKIRSLFGEEIQRREESKLRMAAELERAFAFVKDSFGDGQEMILFVTAMTGNKRISEFISRFGCESYFIYSEKLLGGKGREYDLQKECIEILSAQS